MSDYIPSFYRYVSSITITAGGVGYNNVPTIEDNIEELANSEFLHRIIN